MIFGIKYFYKTLIIVLLGLIMSLSTTIPLVTAEETCDCYCAKKEGAIYENKLTRAGCAEACESKNSLVAACAFSTDQLPSQNLRCFTPESCENQNGTLEKPQPECPPEMGYCYPDDDLSIPLNVSIGPLQVTSGYGEYVQVVYQWMAGVAILFAIVMILIGGLQYSMAAGSGETAQAKKRITNSVIGLVLVLCTYLILYTVNPQLVKLQVPKLPLIRQVQLVQGESCG
jgi:hypothetical protein